jgi:arylsulfatase A-like enzyme
MSTLELGTRIPMLFRAPWITTARGVVTQALAEAVDLYPTCVIPCLTRTCPKPLRASH